MEIGVHLPQLALAGGALSSGRLQAAAQAARRLGCRAVSANDHFDFAEPWLDGLVALAAAAHDAGELELMTSVALPSLRGPVPLAAALAGLNRITHGSVVAGVGPGSSVADQQLMGFDAVERWQRFDSSVVALKEVLDPNRTDRPASVAVAADPIPVWVASWGSAAGLRRVARLGDGWVASAYNTSPDQFGTGLERLREELDRRGRSVADFPHALVTMWLWVTDDQREADRMLEQLLAPTLGRTPQELRDRVCIGSVERCADLLGRYAAVGCRRIHVWPLGDEAQQLERLMSDVLPRATPSPPRAWPRPGAGPRSS